MELTNDQKATIEYFRKHPGKLVDGRDGSNHGDDLYTIISSVLDYASAESGKEVVMRLEEDTLRFRVYGKGTKSKEELSRVVLGPPLQFGRMDAESYAQMRRETYYTNYPIYFINILSREFRLISYVDGRFASISCEKGMPLGLDEGVTSEKDGIDISFKLDKECFNGHYSFNVDYIKKSIKYSVARNEGLQVSLEGETIV